MSEPTWPEAFAEVYRREGYWEPRSLGEQLRLWASEHASRNALIERGRRLTYAELDARVDRLAAGFHNLGLVAGDRVVVQLPNGVAFVTACFALFRLGVIPILAMPALREADIGAICELADPAAYLVPDRFLGFLAQTAKNMQ